MGGLLRVVGTLAGEHRHHLYQKIISLSFAGRRFELVSREKFGGAVPVPPIAQADGRVSTAPHSPMPAGARNEALMYGLQSIERKRGRAQMLEKRATYEYHS